MKFLIAAIIAGCCIAMPVRAQQTSLEKLVQETQQVAHERERAVLVWWIPTEFWARSLESSPNLSARVSEQFLAVVRNYTIVAVLDGKLSPVGGVQGLSKEQIEETISLESKGIVLRPLANEELSADITTLLQMMRPFIANMLGQLGQNVHFIVFKGEAPDGTRYADPTRPGRLKVTLSERVFEWKLPLAALLPTQFDPETGDAFPGNYRYSPFTGKTLSATPPAARTQN